MEKSEDITIEYKANDMKTIFESVVEWQGNSIKYHGTFGAEDFAIHIPKKYKSSFENFFANANESQQSTVIFFASLINGKRRNSSQFMCTRISNWPKPVKAVASQYILKEKKRNSKEHQ